MRILIQILLLLAFIPSFSQNFQPTEINVAGAENTGSDYSFSFSVGGIAVSTLENDKIVTQGFQQPYNVFISDLKYYRKLKLKAKAFPNPALDVIHLSLLGDNEPVLCYVRIINNNGLVVHVPSEDYVFAKGQNITLNLKKIPEGNYVIQVISKESNSILVDFKVVKL